MRLWRFRQRVASPESSMPPRATKRARWLGDQRTSEHEALPGSPNKRPSLAPTFQPQSRNASARGELRAANVASARGISEMGRRLTLPATQLVRRRQPGDAPFQETPDRPVNSQPECTAHEAVFV